MTVGLEDFGDTYFSKPVGYQDLDYGGDGRMPVFFHLIMERTLKNI